MSTESSSDDDGLGLHVSEQVTHAHIDSFLVQSQFISCVIRFNGISRGLYGVMVFI